MPQTLNSGSFVAFLLESTASLYPMVLQSEMTLSIREAIARAPKTLSQNGYVCTSTKKCRKSPATTRRSNSILTVAIPDKRDDNDLNTVTTSQTTE